MFVGKRLYESESDFMGESAGMTYQAKKLISHSAGTHVHTCTHRWKCRIVSSTKSVLFPVPRVGLFRVMRVSR